MTQLTKQYRTCFISAPFGLDLEALPSVLEERDISWEWGKGAKGSNEDIDTRIEASDFVIVVLNGTKADYRSTFDAGMAIGLNKPVFMLQTNARALPLDFRRFTTVKAKLTNKDAIGLHLDLFLAAPASTTHITDRKSTSSRPPLSGQKGREAAMQFASQLEQRAYEAVIAAGGSAIVEPGVDAGSRYRPDLLAWLGNLDAELLDPVVIEVKARADAKTARRVEEQLLSFMQKSRIRTGLVLTADSPPKLSQKISPNVLWMTIDEFENLANNGRLGGEVREVRNRIAHGSR
jgi:nucleoside 2-deoxyribosyltransferase